MSSWRAAVQVRLPQALDVAGTCLFRPSSETAQCTQEGLGRPAGVLAVSLESQIETQASVLPPRRLWDQSFVRKSLHN